MLILSRKEEEGFQIGPEIHVRVIELGKGRVRLAVRAPREMLILRDELRDGDFTAETPSRGEGIEN